MARGVRDGLRRLCELDERADGGNGPAVCGLLRGPRPRAKRCDGLWACPRAPGAIAMTRPRTAFVLSGGASLGALQVGMLRALYERGITADLLVGTSVGALNAAFIASRPQTPATATELATVWSNVGRADAFPVGLRTFVGGLIGQRDHLVPTHALPRIVRSHLQLDDLAEAAIPLHVIAFDITTAAEAVLSEG